MASRLNDPPYIFNLFTLWFVTSYMAASCKCAHATYLLKTSLWWGYLFYFECKMPPATADNLTCKVFSSPFWSDILSRSLHLPHHSRHLIAFSRSCFLILSQLKGNLNAHCKYNCRLRDGQISVLKSVGIIESLLKCSSSCWKQSRQFCAISSMLIRHCISNSLSPTHFYFLGGRFFSTGLT